MPTTTVSKKEICQGPLCFKFADWEKIKCRIGGRRLRTACKTIAQADREAFRAGAAGTGLLHERADDFLQTWDIGLSGDSVDQVATYGISKADLAELHISNVSGVCLALEAGRHTCHPDEAPGRLFYDAAREQFREQIKQGRFRWRAPTRGGTGGDGVPPGTPPAPGTGTPAPGNEPKPAVSTGMLAAAAVVAFLVLR